MQSVISRAVATILRFDKDDAHSLAGVIAAKPPGPAYRYQVGVALTRNDRAAHHAVGLPTGSPDVLD